MSVLAMDDHESRAFKVTATIFLPGMRNTSIDLARGECLWTLSDARGLEEAGYCGKQSVLLLTDDFGSWPIAAFKVRVAHAKKWREITPDAAGRMLERVKRAVAAARGEGETP